ncbi:MAG: zinc-binding dehydrogenase [Chloroflexota bacterium]
MTRTGKIVVANGKDFAVQEHPVPDPKPGTVLLKQELAGICGTDLHIWQNGYTSAVVPGHENVGVVEAMGSNDIVDHNGKPVKEGDRLIFAPGTLGHGGYGFMKPPEFHGGFAEYISLDIPTTCFMKTDVPAEVAVLTEPFTIGVHAVMRGNVEIGDTVVVQGSGAIGLVTLICARLSGAGKIIMVGGPADRLELAKEFGADVTIDIDEVTSVEERTEIVKSHTTRGEGADQVFECAGFLPATPEGLGYVRHSGTFIEVGHFVDMGSIDFNINRLLMRKNLTFEAIWGSRYEHFVRGLAILERRDVPIEKMVSHKLSLFDVKKGYEALNGDYRIGSETVIKIAVQAHED